MAMENSLLKTAAADYDAVVAEMAAMREDVSKLAHHVQTMASTRGQAMAKDVSDGMSEAAKYISQKGHNADQRVEGAVGANPYIALGLAAGMGVLLGAMTRR
jgi:ElaB/YqjD/DUF883 family membrane-anchored ribosome-binding protein